MLDECVDGEVSRFRLFTYKQRRAWCTRSHGFSDVLHSALVYRFPLQIGNERVQEHGEWSENITFLFSSICLPFRSWDDRVVREGKAWNKPLLS